MSFFHSSRGSIYSLEITEKSQITGFSFYCAVVAGPLYDLLDIRAARSNGDLYFLSMPA